MSQWKPLCCIAVLVLAAGLDSAHAQDTKFKAGNPRGEATKQNPMIIRVGGNTIKVTNIEADLEPGDKAKVIFEAIKAQSGWDGTYNGPDASFVINNCGGIWMQSDPTKEDYDILASSDVGSAGMNLVPGALPTGLDPEGHGSVIRFGIEGVHIAEFFPTSADSLEDILSFLQQDAFSHGIPAVYYPGQLRIEIPELPADLNFVFGTSDAGLDLRAHIVPEPAAAILAVLGGSLLMARRRNRRTSAI